MTRRTWCLGAALILLVSTVLRSQSPLTVAQAAREFRSGSIKKRMAAFESFDRPANWARPAAAQALLALLEREDSLAAAVGRESAGRLAAGDKYGEGYGEYSSDVEDRCLKYCDREAMLTHILDNVSHVPELRAGEVEWLSAIYGDSLFSPGQRARINSAFIVGARDATSFITRSFGLRAVRVALRSGLTSAADSARFHQAVVADAWDPYLDNRLDVIHQLGQFHDPADLPLLQRLALTDTAQRVEGGRTIYPVRVAARAEYAAMTGRSP